MYTMFAVMIRCFSKDGQNMYLKLFSYPTIFLSEANSQVNSYCLQWPIVFIQTHFYYIYKGKMMFLPIKIEEL